MARLKDLLAYGRRSDRRRTRCSGSLQAFRLMTWVCVAFGFVSQLARILFGPVSVRLQSAEHLVIALTSFWLLVPLSVRPSIPASSLQFYPITDRQRLIYRLLSHAQSIQVLVLTAASLISILAFVCVPEPAARMAQAVLCFLLAGCVGCALASGSAQLFSRSYLHGTRKGKTLKSRAFHLFYKEIRYFARTLDPYVGLLLSAAFAYSEYLVSWLTPAKIALPMLLVAMIQLPAIVNLFGFDGPSEMNRYRLMPLPPWKISLHKHLALTAILFLTVSPLVAAAMIKMTLQEELATLVELCIIVISWLCSGVMLMRLDESRKIALAFGSLSGEGFSFGLFGLAILLLISAPIASVFVLRSGNLSLAMVLCAGLLCILSLGYALCLPSSSQSRLRLD